MTARPRWIGSLRRFGMADYMSSWMAAEEAVADLESRHTAMETELDAANASIAKLTSLLREARNQWGLGVIFAEDRDLRARIDKAVPPEPA